MIKYKWTVDRHFGGSHGGIVEASDRIAAMSKAQTALENSGHLFGGNVKQDTLRLTHQFRPGKKKWQVLPSSPANK